MKLVLAGVLALGLVCLFSVRGNAEVQGWMTETEVAYIDFLLLHATVPYMMQNPTNYPEVLPLYDRTGELCQGLVGELPGSVNTRGKIVVSIRDNRDVFTSLNSKLRLMEFFKAVLEDFYGWIKDMATDMDSDVVALFFSKKDVFLGYFYKGKYVITADLFE